MILNLGPIVLVLPHSIPSDADDQWSPRIKTQSGILKLRKIEKKNQWQLEIIMVGKSETCWTSKEK